MRCALLMRTLVTMLAGLAWTSAQAADEITFGITSATALSLPHFIAEAKTYYLSVKLE
jgi:hypothetical protein